MAIVRMHGRNVDTWAKRVDNVESTLQLRLLGRSSPNRALGRDSGRKVPYSCGLNITMKIKGKQR